MTEGEALQSMTGFGAAEGASETASWRWELRSVNGKSLDAKFKLPQGAESLEQFVRTELRKLQRGTINISLRIEKKDTVVPLVVDDEGLAAAMRAIGKVQQAIDCAKPRPEAVLSMRGVLAAPTMETALSDEDLAQISASFEEALAALLGARTKEGARVGTLLKDRCSNMLSRVDNVREQTKDAREKIAERLRAQLGELLAQHVEDDRLAQEAAMLAIRADVTEELDRLSVHTRSFQDLLAKGGAAGRRLEFLTQELMREASTLTAKLHTAELKNEGLDLKELVDSLREQVLNLA